MVMGEDNSCLEDIKIAVEKKLPVILVKGSELCDKMIGYLNEKTKFYNEEVEELLEKGHFYTLENDKSEDIAAFTHFFLTVTPY